MNKNLSTNKQETSKEVGDMIVIKTRPSSKPIILEGRVKEVRKTYGRNEYLMTNMKVKSEDMWIRSFEE